MQVLKCLDNYYITNDPLCLHLFRFSGNLQISAHGYLILWATKDLTRGNTHLPFKISASGESVYIYAPDGHTLVNSMTIGKQKSDVSFGRTTDGATSLSFFAKPTPGKTNNTSTGYLGILNPPTFSQPAGFYGNPFTLTIASDDPAARIIYTTDGSNPDENNISGTSYRYKNVYPELPGDPVGPFLSDAYRSYNYSTALNIKDASTDPNRLSLKSSTYYKVFKTPLNITNKGTMVRAVAVKNGYIPSEIITSTYFVTSDGKNKYTLPIVSIAIPEETMYSWDSGIYNAGTDFEKWRALNPSATASGVVAGNWNRDVEIPASLEFFTANNVSREFQTNIGTTVNGNASRKQPQKSLRVYFRSSYGQSDINYKIFSDLPYKNYERLIFNDGGSDMKYSHMRDMVIENSVRHLNFAVQHQQPVVEFVNGEFWGLINVRERYDDNYFKQIWGIDKDSLDFLENKQNLNNGTTTAITTLRNYISTHDLSVTANYQTIQTQMDVDNFLDYHVTEVYFGNDDWPDNNISYFRKRVPYTPGAPKGHDGRFRWMLNDMDKGLGLGGPPSFNSMQWATGTSSGVNPVTWSTEMLKKLLMNQEFKNKFITRYADLLNTTFLPVNIDSIINVFRNLYSPHISEHTQRWRYPSTATIWNDTVNAMVSWSDQRPAFAKQQIRDYFSLGAEKKLTIDVSDSALGYITVNTVDITPAFPGVPKKAYPWSGNYYAEIPVTLIARPKPGNVFLRWEGDATSTKDTLIVTLSTAKSYKAVFQKVQVPDESKVFHYWHFNNLPGGTLTSVAADTSLPGNAVITYPGTGAGYMDATGNTEGSDVNLQFNKISGTASATQKSGFYPQSAHYCSYNRI